MSVYNSNNNSSNDSNNSSHDQSGKMWLLQRPGLEYSEALAILGVKVNQLRAHIIAVISYRCFSLDLDPRYGKIEMCELFI